MATFINHKDKLVFIHIPKNAGKTIGTNLGLEKYRNSPENIKMRQKIGVENFQHYGLKEIEKYLEVDLKGYLPISSVRNPWSWHVSWYNWVKKLNPNLIPGLNRMSFSDYVNRLAKVAEESPDRCLSNCKHCDLSQLYWLESENLSEVECIIRFEHLKEDWLALLEKHNFKFTRKLGHHHRNSSGPIDYKKHYDKRTRKIVEELNKEFIERFNYTF